VNGQTNTTSVSRPHLDLPIPRHHTQPINTNKKTTNKTIKQNMAFKNNKIKKENKKTQNAGVLSTISNNKNQIEKHHPGDCISQRDSARGRIKTDSAKPKKKEKKKEKTQTSCIQ
jgi:hypothetical protein